MSRAKRILLLEPYYGGSHKRWADAYAANSLHDVKLETLSDAHWKWRMHGAAVSLAGKLQSHEPEVILCSSMMDVATLKAMLPKELVSIPLVCYFHENQLAYPFQGDDAKDRHYAWINYTSALAADLNVFNSAYNRNSFLEKLVPYLKAFPDHQNLQTILEIEAKSEVVYPGVQLDKFTDSGDKVANRILWNHRWEYDKGPEAFLNLLHGLEQKGLAFELVLLGEQYAKIPDAMSHILIQYADSIVHQGWVENEFEYRRLVSNCAVLPVTSEHEFYGYSVVEAILSGCFPILPNRLVYPEYAQHLPADCFYDSCDDLIETVARQINSPAQFVVSETFRQIHDLQTSIDQLDLLVLGLLS